MNAELVRDIYEGYLTYMYMSSSKLFNLYAEMRNMIVNSDITNNDDITEKIMVLKNKADALTATLPNMSEMTIDELDTDIEDTDVSPSIVYCEKTYAGELWETYATLKLKILFDEDYKRAYLEKTNLAELEATRRELDARTKSCVQRELYEAMYCCLKCKTPLSDTELDEKAIDIHYEDGNTYHGCSSVCATCFHNEA